MKQVSLKLNNMFKVPLNLIINYLNFNCDSIQKMIYYSTSEYSSPPYNNFPLHCCHLKMTSELASLMVSSG